MSTVNQVTTELLTLSEVKNRNLAFLIPSYQRPYVWSEDDVKTLFTDIGNACEHGEKQYFIGNALSAARHNERHQVYELIDGQQRITSLMLISIAFKAAGVDSPLFDVALLNNESRLGFEIRDSVKNLLGSYAGLDAKYATRPSEYEVENDPYLKPLADNLHVLKQQVDRLDSNKKRKLADYIFNQVKWVNNIVPVEMDLNRMFHSMNTAGIQLQPVDLLKAKLLKQITTEKRLYSTIWQVCEHQENYFERNVRASFDADWNAITYADLSCYSSKLIIKKENDHLDKDFKAAGKTLSQLLIENTETKLSEQKSKTIEHEENSDKTAVYCRSIISFELLLIHTLRIFNAQQGWQDLEPRIRSGNLLACFELLLKEDEVTIKAFFKLLWQVRYQFDTWVMKWVEYDDDQGEQLRLTYLSRSMSSGAYYINRSPKSLGELVQLQAVRYFTGERSAQYWLSALLARLVRKNLLLGSDSESKVLAWLEEIDNQLSLTTETQKEASYKIVSGAAPSMQSWQEQESYFSESRGTSFEHYWFQKLEYLLWKQRDKNDEKASKYRITSKNSVEHVHPRNEERGIELEKEALDAFGNLVLLSPGENSSYSNQTIGKKEADFKDKPRYDSLKLKELFALYEEKRRGWISQDVRDRHSKLISQHQQQMITVLRRHYSLGEAQVINQDQNLS